MHRGTERHAVLEAEVQVAVPLAVAGPAERCALIIINAIGQLRCLLAAGVVRELQVFGRLQGAWVSGKFNSQCGLQDGCSHRLAQWFLVRCRAAGL